MSYEAWVIVAALVLATVIWIGQVDRLRNNDRQAYEAIIEMWTGIFTMFLLMGAGNWLDILWLKIGPVAIAACLVLMLIVRSVIIRTTSYRNRAAWLYSCPPAVACIAVVMVL